MAAAGEAPAPRGMSTGRTALYRGWVIMTPIFVAATGQNAGKTTTSLGLYHFFRKNGARTGFIKPVGQRYLLVDSLRVDEDSILLKEIFGMDESLETMSPVSVPKGFTSEYVMNKAMYGHLADDIKQAYAKVSRDKDVVIIEGTGHAGVGSIFDLSNATVARMLGADVIIVSEGGIGRAFDEIVLNAALFESAGVHVIGAIVNKIRDDHYDKVKTVVSRALVDRGLCPIAFLPYRSTLSAPSVSQIAEKLHAEYLCNEDEADDHVENTVIAGMEALNVIPLLTRHSLVIMSGDRVDNILVSMSSHLMGDSANIRISALLLTHGFRPHDTILELLRKAKIPVMLTNQDTYSVASQVHSMNVKTLPSDAEKIDMIKTMVETHINADCLLPSGSTCHNCAGHCAIKALVG
jgi:phosphate acetyltransferase